jgi:predicted outer membrane repeat protein
LNPNIFLIDLDSYNSFNIIQTEHPYESAKPPYNIIDGSIYDPDAVEFILIFDSQTNLYFNDMLYIYNIQGDLIYQKNSNWPGISLPSLRIPGPGFTYNVSPVSSTYTPTSTSDNYYGIKLYVIPVYNDSMVPNIFNNNYASQGSAIFMNTINNFPAVLNTLINNNIAQFEGSGIYLGNSNTGITFQQVSFDSNIAGIDGGGFYLSTAHSGIIFKSCNFSSNVAVRFGGAGSLQTSNGHGLLSSNNEILFENCLFNNNQGSVGGAIYTGTNNVITLSNCNIEKNYANPSVYAVDNNGGGFYLDSSNILNILNCEFNHNSADKNGGSIASNYANNIYINSAIFSNNTALVSGGGIWMNDDTSVEFDESTTYFLSNNAYAGGAISVFSSNLWTMNNDANLLIKSNAAKVGSGIFFKSLVYNSISLQDIEFTHNNASEGGTVYWLYDDIMDQEPRGLDSPSLIWNNNSASYGSKYGTQPTRLISPSTYNVTIYAQTISPPIIITLKDFYNQFMPVEGVISIYTTIHENNFDCGGRFAFISGSDVLGIEMKQGEASFNNLEVFCSPNGNVSLSFEARLNDYSFSSQLAVPYYISNYSELVFRDCEDGEFQIDGLCLVCPPGTYSLKYIGVDTQCINCNNVGGIEACQSNQIVVTEGTIYLTNYQSNYLTNCQSNQI